MGSASELEYFLLLARDLEYLSSSDNEAVADEVSKMRRMLNCLISKVQGERVDAQHGERRLAKLLSANC